jgi:hypothetical protein
MGPVRVGGPAAAVGVNPICLIFVDNLSTKY